MQLVNVNRQKNKEEFSMAAIALTKETFQDQIKSGVTLVDFWAPWCGPCKVAVAKDNKHSIIAGIAFLKGSRAITSKIKAATSIAEPSSNPDNKAAIGIQIPTNIPIEPTISIKPVKKLNMDGRPNRLNSFAIFPEIILVPVNIKNIPNTTCKMINNITIGITLFLAFEMVEIPGYNNIKGFC
jgi:thiol-disulfide isomerase/thioredoxin